jgi:hypothetical protein
LEALSGRHANYYWYLIFNWNERRYPTITATLFRVPQCIELGDREYHEEDFTINCQSGQFYFFATVSFGLIIAIPIGVPAIFLFLMNRARSKLPGGRVNATLLGGAKLVPDTMEDDKDSYGFLCRDCKPEYWYYEIVSHNSHSDSHSDSLLSLAATATATAS